MIPFSFAACRKPVKLVLVKWAIAGAAFAFFVIAGLPAGGPSGARAAAEAVPAKAESPKVEPKKDTPSAGPRKVEVLVKDRKFKTEGPGDHLRVSYDDLDLLKVLNMEPVTLDAVEKMPAWLRQLDGKPIRIRGFMYPPNQETGISRFILARDNQICCFGRNPKIYDLIEINMQSGTTTDFIMSRPFDVTGTFKIEMGEMLSDGLITGLYFIENAAVIQK